MRFFSGAVNEPAAGFGYASKLGKLAVIVIAHYVAGHDDVKKIVGVG